jgi:hypothetical protein
MNSAKGMFQGSLNYVIENRDKTFNSIPFSSFPRFNNFLPGVIKGNYYLIGAYSGDGKTNTTDSMFLYDVYDFYKENKDKMDIKISWLYFSFEVVKNAKAIKAVSRKMYKDYGIVADMHYLSGYKESRATDEVINYYKSAIGYYEELEDLLKIQDIPENPTGLNKHMWNFAEQHGTIHTKMVTTNEGKQIKVFDKYEPNHPNHYVIVVVDHVALSPLERGYTTKTNIDKLSEYAVDWRNRFNFIPVFIQQFSADTMSMERQKQGKTEPDANSFGDSKYTFRDANNVFALFNPFKFEQRKHRGYDITLLQDHYRYLSLLKSRDGIANVGVGTYFHGGVNFIKELPKSTDLVNMDKVYAKLNADRKNIFGS